MIFFLTAFTQGFLVHIYIETGALGWFVLGTLLNLVLLCSPLFAYERR